MDVIIHNQIESLEEIVPEWEELQNKFREVTIFQNVEWMKIWWEYNKHSKEITTPYIVEIREESETIGVIPLCVTKRRFANLRFRILKPIGIVESNCLLPILSKKYSPEQLLTKAMEKIYQDKKNWDCINWVDLPEESSFDSFFNARPPEEKKFIYRGRSSITSQLLLTNDMGEVMSKVNKKFLKGILYDNRKLNREGELKFHRVENESEIEPIMYKLFELHCERWENTSTPSVFEETTEREYYMQLAISLFKSNLLYLAYLTHNNDIIGVNFGMADGKTNWLHTHAMDIKYRKYSIGHLLAYYIIINSHEENYDVIDFLRGNTDFKQKWGTVGEFNLEYLIFNNSLKSLLYRLVNRTYFSKQFIERPFIKQVPVKIVIRVCSFFLGINDNIRNRDQAKLFSLGKVQNRI